MTVTPVRTRLFREGQALATFIANHVPQLPEQSVLAVTSKIVSLSQKRTAGVSDERTRIRLIRQESQWAMRTRYTWLTIKDGTVMASAGIDASNGNGKLVLLPRDSFTVARELRQVLRRHYRRRRLGVLITDSRLLPLRAGAVGVALGYAGFHGVRDYRGRPDLFGRRFELSRTDVADSLATAAVLVMGEGAERQPLAIIHDAPVEFCERTNRRELAISPRDDIYQPLFERIKRLPRHVT